jgi:hypothetical protein
MATMNDINSVRESVSAFYPLNGSRVASVRLLYVRSDGTVGYWAESEGSVTLEMDEFDQMIEGRAFIIGFQNNRSSCPVEQAIPTGHSNRPERVEAVKQSLRDWSQQTGAGLSEAEISRRETVQRNSNALGAHVLLEDEGTALHIPVIHMPGLLMRRLCDIHDVPYRHLRVSAASTEYNNTPYEPRLPTTLRFGDAWEVRFAVSKEADEGIWATEAEGCVQIVISIYRNGVVVDGIVATPSEFFTRYVATGAEVTFTTGLVPETPAPRTTAMINRIVQFDDEAADLVAELPGQRQQGQRQQGQQNQRQQGQRQQGQRQQGQRQQGQRSQRQNRATADVIGNDEAIPF